MDSLEIIPQKHSGLGRLLLGSKIKPIPETREPNPAENNPFKSIIWSYLDYLVRIGYDRVIQPQDIPALNPKRRVSRRLDAYNSYLNKHKPTPETNYIEIWAIIYALRWDIIHCITVSLFSTGCQIGMSLLSQRLIKAAEALAIKGSSHPGYGKAIGFLVGFCIMDSLRIVTESLSGFTNSMFVGETKRALMAIIHNKMLKLGPQQRHDYSAAKIITLVGTDTRRASAGLMSINQLFTFPVNFGASLGILIYMIGVSALPGLGLIVLGVVVSAISAYYVSNLRGLSMPFMDKRISLTRETLKNINIVKFYGWEKPYAKLILSMRKHETKYIRLLEAVDSLNTSLVQTVPSWAGALSFSVKIIISSSLGPAAAFPALSLFQSFSTSLSEISFILTSLADSRVSAKRMNKFFRLPEVDTYIETLPDSPETEDILFTVKDADFAWVKSNEDDQNETQNCEATANSEVTETSDVILRDVKFTIHRNTMNIAVGKVGSGKSSLLSIFLNAIPKISGSVKVAENCDITGVLSQWSSSGTVRDNILFGLPLNMQRYAETVRICDLKSDFKLFVDGDNTQIGENGVTLSGGQKARLALARCIYSGSDLIVLDDVLSAMDIKVGNYIFKELRHLTRTGNKTIVFSTNNLKWLNEADSVLVLNGDGCVTQSRNKREISSLTEVFPRTDDQNSTVHHPDTVHAEVKRAEDDTNTAMISQLDTTSQLDITTDKVKIPPLIDEVRSIDSNPDSDKEKTAGVTVKSEKLTQDEDRALGSVKNEVIIRYFGMNRIDGFILTCLMLLALCCFSTSYSMSNVILNWWTGDKYPRSQGFYIGIYCMDVSLLAVFYSVFAILFSILATNSSTTLHNGAIEGLYRTTTTYFHQNPLGRILTRFTTDMVGLDTSMIAYGRNVCLTLFPMLASMVVIFVYIPWTILCLIPIFASTLVLFAYYIPVSREVNRCDILYQSKSMQILNENIEGQEIIVYYNQSENSKKKLYASIDDSIVSYIYNVGTHYWASVRAGLLSEIISFAALFLAVFNVFSLTPSEVGLMISLLPTIGSSLTGFLPMYALFYNQMNSVERLDEYATRLPVEGASVSDNLDPTLKEWKPNKCDLDFQNISLRYRDGLPLALNQLTLSIKGGQKVGICGRTGAGKSTIISALFRFVELSSGDIKIDGHSISHFPLETLRAMYAIIPQAPVLFQGTVRSNLDPFDEHSDEVLIEALNNAGLSVVKGNKFNPDSPVEAEGTNFSLGERQMIALARVLLRNSSILILDEATAAVDEETDARIQKVIKKKYHDRTVLCIAHRLETILDYDVIVVMGPGGTLLETGSPRELLSQQGVFADMCREAGVRPE